MLNKLQKKIKKKIFSNVEYLPPSDKINQYHLPNSDYLYKFDITLKY